MKYGICHLSIVPCRIEPSDKSEMVTQLLFGETVKIYEEKRADWSKIKTSFDDYECWVDKKQLLEISQDEYEKMNATRYVVSDLVHVIKQNINNELTPIVIGSNLPNLEQSKVHFQEMDFSFDGSSIHTLEANEKSKLIEHAYMYLNAPYLWGGRSPFGIDCSGFSQILYKLIGFKLP